MEKTEHQILLDAVNNLAAILTEIKEDLVPKREYRSPQVNEIFAALAKAQASMRVASMGSENPYFKNKYADLTSIVKASRTSLTDNGLCVIQQILTEDGQSILFTTLAHSSGQWIQSAMRILPPKNDVQSLGSYITYLKRYSYAALIGVVTDDNIDDDGEVVVAPQRELAAKGVALNTKYNPLEETFDTITKEQLEELDYELSEYPDIAMQVLDGLKLQNLADMPKSKYHISLKRIREIKQARNGK